MKQLATMLALAGMLWAPALGAQPGGISGTVVDAKTGQPMAHATLYYYRSPYLEKGPNHVATLQTNGRGFFSDVTLEPGRYVVMARFPGKVEGCAIDDVMAGEVTRMRGVSPIGATRSQELLLGELADRLQHRKPGLP